MPSPIALQLYSVREAIAATSYETMVRKVAEIGYAGVETAGFPGTTPQAAGKLFKELGLTVCSIHSFPIPDEARKQEVVDTLGALDCKVAVSGAGPDDFKTVDITKVTCEKLNAAAAMLKPAGIRLGVHNHWWEYLPLDGGKYAYEYMLDFLSPDVFFEIDTYWVKTAGVDPAKVVKRLGGRAPYLHIKDGPAQKGVPQLAVGEGVLDFPAVIKAGEGNTEWLIVELDGCATDMLEAVRKSHAYLTSKGLAAL
jgi:sugar phosphate isomerase/epimerase